MNYCMKIKIIDQAIKILKKFIKKFSWIPIVSLLIIFLIDIISICIDDSGIVNSLKKHDLVSQDFNAVSLYKNIIVIFLFFHTIIAIAYIYKGYQIQKII